MLSNGTDAVESIANLSDTIACSYLITLHYIFSYFWVELSNVKSSFVLYLIFYTYF